MGKRILVLAMLLMGVSAGVEVALADAPAAVQMVDLGLSVKWANMNVGATSPEKSGLYFAMGETQGYTDDTKDGRTFNWANYKWCNGSSSTLTKYCTESSYGYNGFTDGKTTLDSIDDAATVNWGGEWRMPTDAEWTELRAQCTWTWTKVKGVSGYRVSASNGNSIFLPAAGYRYTDGLLDVASHGYYWSSSFFSGSMDFAHSLFFYAGKYYGSKYHFRYFGFPVRPVCP